MAAQSGASDGAGGGGGGLRGAGGAVRRVRRGRGGRSGLAWRGLGDGGHGDSGEGSREEQAFHGGMVPAICGQPAAWSRRAMKMAREGSTRSLPAIAQL